MRSLDPCAAKSQELSQSLTRPKDGQHCIQVSLFATEVERGDQARSHGGHDMAAPHHNVAVPHHG